MPVPNRILKESICTSESIDQLKPFEETFYYRLIVNCDDYGCMDGREKILKSKLFPLKETITVKNISDALGKLASLGLVVRYELDGKPFLFLPTWEVHQQIRAKRRKYPEPPDDINGNQMISSDCNSPRNPIQSESESESESQSESKRKKTDLESVVVEFTDNSELRESIQGFIEMRKLIKKPLTARALRSSLKTLVSLSDEVTTQIAIIDQTTERAWQTFYPLKDNDKSGQSTGNPFMRELEKDNDIVDLNEL